MSTNTDDPDNNSKPEAAGGRMGSLRDALMAAGRTMAPSAMTAAAQARDAAKASDETILVRRSAVQAAAAPQSPIALNPIGLGPVARGTAARDTTMHDENDAPRTMLVRGKQKVDRSNFHQDPVVAWLVVVGGPGLGAYRPVYEGNNTIGRAASQRIAIDFGDEGISSEEQAYLRYDSTDRRFLFVPNLAKTNVVSVNDTKPTGALELHGMDVIMMGRTQLAFVPFCGPDFDWAELTEAKR